MEETIVVLQKCHLVYRVKITSAFADASRKAMAENARMNQASGSGETGSRAFRKHLSEWICWQIQ